MLQFFKRQQQCFWNLRGVSIIIITSQDETKPKASNWELPTLWPVSRSPSRGKPDKDGMTIGNTKLGMDDGKNKQQRKYQLIDFPLS